MKRVFAGFLSVLALAALSPWRAAALQDAPAAPVVALPSLRECRAEIQQLTDAAKHDAAAQLIASVLARPDGSAADERERAEFHFAAGVAFGAAQSYDEAARSAHAARGLAGSSELGLASAYNAGTFRLLRAEQLRLEIPEVRQALKLPPITPATPGASPQTGSMAGPVAGSGGGSLGGGPPGVDQAADPLGAARAAYLAARADLVERWRADPADVDTRANVELAVRRLRELDELERERDEQKQDPNERQDQDQKQDPQKQDSQQDKGEEPKDGEKQEPPEDPQQDSEPKSPEDKPEDKPDESAEDEQPDPKADEEQDESKPEQDKPKDGAEPAKPEDERLLTPEEIQRLLQQLDKIEDQAAQVQAALRRARRVPVKKDW